MEYLEKIDERISAEAAVYIERLLTDAPSVMHVEPEYKWRLISDPDDNKFADAYVASNADYLVTEDGHFRSLLSLAWPKIQVIGIKDFMRIIGHPLD